jgi:hypothetical protein
MKQRERKWNERKIVSNEDKETTTKKKIKVKDQTIYPFSKGINKPRR